MQLQENKIDITNYHIPLTEDKHGGLPAEEDRIIFKKRQQLIKLVDKDLSKFRFAQAAELLYQFVWHELADKYIEHIKTREDKANCLRLFYEIYMDCLKLLHPFMPFVTEEIYQRLLNNGSLMISKWPG